MPKKKYVWSPTQSGRDKRIESHDYSNSSKGKGKSCIYFDTEKLTCKYFAERKLFQFCKNASACKYYKKKLSKYNDTYIQLPLQEYYHSITKDHFLLTKNIGTPCHSEYLKMKSGDARRDKRRCIYYEKSQKWCSHNDFVCPGSTHCDDYIEY